MGQAWTTAREVWDECYPPPSTFSTSDIPDLTGKVIIVTGGYSGIGYEIVKALLPRNARVYIASRDKQKAQEAITELKSLTGREALFLELDLANLKSVKRAAEEFMKRTSCIFCSTMRASDNLRSNS